jgi:cell division protein FtsL
MRGPGFFDRRIRGFRIVELGAMAVLVVLVLVVYLFKDGAGDKRADIDRVQEQIVAEQEQIRLLKAEVAHQEQPERLETLAGQYLNLAPVNAKHEVDAAALPDIARVEAQTVKSAPAATPASAPAAAPPPAAPAPATAPQPTPAASPR